MTEQVDLDAQQVSNGAAQWEAASTALTSGWQNALSEITALNNPGTWGGDRPGSAFAAAYQANGGPEEVLFGADGGQAVIDQIAELGPKVEKAAGFSLAADEEQAAEMLKPQVNKD